MSLKLGRPSGESITGYHSRMARYHAKLSKLDRNYVRLVNIAAKLKRGTPAFKKAARASDRALAAYQKLRDRGA